MAPFVVWLEELASNYHRSVKRRYMGPHVGHRFISSPLFHPILSPHAGRRPPSPAPPELPPLRRSSFTWPGARAPPHSAPCSFPCAARAGAQAPARTARAPPRSSSTSPSPPSSGQAHPRCSRMRSTLSLRAPVELRALRSSPSSALPPSVVRSSFARGCSPPVPPEIRALRPRRRAPSVPAPVRGADRKSTRLNSSHTMTSRMPSSA